MIQSIINELKNNKEISGHYEISDHLHYSLISSGRYRTYQRGRINFLIFNEKGNPLFFVKFYKDKQMNKLIEYEFEKQHFLCTTYKNLKIPEPLAILNINGFSIMVEEAFSGKTLSRLLSENPSIERVIEVIDYGKKVQDELNESLLLSSFSEFEREVKELIHTFTSIYNPTPFEDLLIKKSTDFFLERFKHKQVYKRFTNGDFVPKNIILPSDCLPILIDFEFVEETHLYFIDWFRFFTYYFNVPPELIQPILEHEFEDSSINAALFRFRDPKEFVNNTTIGTMWLVFHMKDFIIKSYVMPDQELKKEREHLRSMLTSLLSSVFSQDQGIIDLIRDYHIKSLEAGLEEREHQIRDFNIVSQRKDEQIKDLGGQITAISSQVNEKEQQIHELTVAIQGKNEQIRDFETQIADISDQIKEKDERIEDLGGQITAISSQVNEKALRINELTGAIQEKDAQIKNLEGHIVSLENVINSMQRSAVWQLLMRYHNGFVERALPQGTRRRRMYDTGLFSLQIISTDGVKVSLKKVKNKICPPKNDLFPIRELGKKVNKKETVVDVIVPVYNAYEDTKKCIESLLSSTGLTPYRLVIINDKSTDPRITHYLDYLKQKKYSNLIIVTNENNIGFVKTVNKGMYLSENDVVILNSDTIVTYNWLNRLRECAYIDEKIATATPLSNNATICSVPNFDQYNDVPKGYTIQEFALLIEKVSHDLDIKCSKIPVGIGFCLYIKREVINAIGYYDEIFGRGYNEENDFCMRAHEKGYYHVVDLSTYIYHKGKASFMGDQAILEEKNSKLLLQRYPYYMDLVRDFTGRNPLKKVQNSIKSRIKPDRNTPIRIGLDAQLLARDRKTGSEVYISTILEKMLKIDENIVYVAFSSSNTIDSLYYTKNKFMRKHATDSRDILLDSESIDVFHRPIQCFSVYDLLILLKAKRSVITILDLILYHYPSYFNSRQEALQYKRLLELSTQVADRVIAISEHGKKDIIQNLGIPESKVDVTYLGVETNKFKKIDNEDELNEFKKKYCIKKDYILYIGTDFPHKNHKNLILAFKKIIKDKDDIDLVLAGPSTSMERRINIEAAIYDIKDRVIFLDYVDDNDIVYLYNSAALFVYPSLYEGFGLPLLEAMACGVPIVASNGTSIPEVVGDAAVLVDGRNVEALCEGMYKVLTDEALRTRLVENGLKQIKKFQWQETAKKTMNTYEKAYKSSEKNAKKNDAENIKELLNLLPSDENRLILDVIQSL